MAIFFHITRYGKAVNMHATNFAEALREMVPAQYREHRDEPNKLFCNGKEVIEKDACRAAETFVKELNEAKDMATAIIIQKHTPAWWEAISATEKAKT